MGVALIAKYIIGTSKGDKIEVDIVLSKNQIPYKLCYGKSIDFVMNICDKGLITMGI